MNFAMHITNTMIIFIFVGIFGILILQDKIIGLILGLTVSTLYAIRYCFPNEEPIERKDALNNAYSKESRT